MYTNLLDLPNAFIDRMRSQLGTDLEKFLQSYAEPSPTAIRLNPSKSVGIFQEEEAVPWCPLGRYLEPRPSFTHDPLFHAGAYYVQEASSMFLGYALKHFLDLEKDLRVLDLSASPGGKSTHIQSLISPNSLLVANEIIGSRNKVLHQNLTRWGADNVWVSQNDPASFRNLSGYFDALVVDAPCSGEGLFRKDAKARKEWSSDHVLHCAARQKRILADALEALAPGGFLFYSTCTFSEAENEDNLHWLKEEYGYETVRLDIPAEFGVVSTITTLPSYRFYPHRVKGEGFFLAVLRKPGFPVKSGPARPARRHARSPRSQAEGLQQWLRDPQRYTFLERASHSIAIPKVLFQDYLHLSEHLHLTQSGLNLGKVYHGELKPSPELALSTAISTQVPTLELSRAQSIAYLSHLPFRAQDPDITGRKLVRYQGLGLGWINLLKGGQSRNNYPTAWRILKSEDALIS